MSTAVDRAPALKLVRRHYGEGMVRTMLALVCDGCGKQDDRAIRPNLPEDAIAQFFRARGWAVDSRCRSAMCPRCQEKAKVTDISAAAMKRQRQMFLLLDEHFDADAGQYVGDWSDAKIAKETGLAESVVTHARDSAYGPIKVNAALVSAGKDLAELRAQVKREVAEIRSLIESTQQDLLNRIGALEVQVSKAMRRVA